MNIKVILALRIIFGLWLLVFGGNHVFNFFDPPPPPNTAAPYWELMTNIHIITLVGIVEMLAGISLLLNKYAGLMMLIMMSISVNALMMHIHLDTAGLPMGGIMFLLNITMLYVYKDRYRDLLRA